MKITKLFVLSLVTLSAYGILSETILMDIPITRNTIFSDERLEGEIFENIDAVSNIEQASNDISPYRLPTTTKPSHYRIRWIIELNGESSTQSGTVEIDLYATQANVSEIVIHSDELTLSAISLTQGTIDIQIHYIEDKPYEFLRVILTHQVLQYNAGNPVIYTLRISFNAELRKDMSGIYLNWFKNPPDETLRYMASTQFQATAARLAFPCYDEPSLKAHFDVTITRADAYESWFCTRLRETVVSETPGYFNDLYHTTPEMSTYLLAFIVADYGHLRAYNGTGFLLHEVIARHGVINDGQGEYAMKAGQELLAKMSEHTDYNFYEQHPDLKMTQAAIPDFGAGAMENWGLLTYREEYLMYHPEETNSNFKQIIAGFLSHEIAHMWFGNLVTCDWWEVLWLNEGFARYYQYFLTYWVEDMGFQSRFITEQVHTSLLSDSANNPHPLTNPGLANNEAVDAMFSPISYNKGASVIRMTEHFLGSEVHKQGLRNYLRGRAFQTAVPLDLFQYLEQAGLAAGALNYGPDFSFIDYYKSWTDQPGHPVLDVHVNHETGIMTVYQRRFNINTGYSSIGNNYIVPITFATASQPDFENTKPTHVILDSSTLIDRGSVGDEWVVFNKQQTGFYRVNYDEYTWNLIAMALRNSESRKQIHEFNRAQIVNDVFQFARSGLMQYSRALEILSFLADEIDYAPWAAATNGFNWLRNRFAGKGREEQLYQLDSLIGNWASNIMGILGYEIVPGEPFLKAYLRWQLAPLMCNLVSTHGDACRRAALTQFHAMFFNTPSTPVAPDNRNWVYCNALRQDDDVSRMNFGSLWARFSDHNVYTEKILILQNIGCTKHHKSLSIIMNAMFNNSNIIRQQDYNTVFNSIINGDKENTQIAFGYIREMLERVIATYGGFAEIPLSYISAGLRSEEEVNEFIEWANQNRRVLGTAYNSTINGAEYTREGLRWAETIEKDLMDYLGSILTPVTTTTTVHVYAAPEVQLAQKPPTTQPVEPSLPSPPSDSTASSLLATTALILSIMVNLIL